MLYAYITTYIFQDKHARITFKKLWKLFDVSKWVAQNVVMLLSITSAVVQKDAAAAHLLPFLVQIMMLVYMGVLGTKRWILILCNNIWFEKFLFSDFFKIYQLIAENSSSSGRTMVIILMILGCISLLYHLCWKVQSVAKFPKYLMFSSVLIRSLVDGLKLLQFTYTKICLRFQKY